MMYDMMTCLNIYVQLYHHDVTSRMIEHDSRCGYLGKLVVATELLIKDHELFPIPF